MNSPRSLPHGWRVVLAGLGINLALGVLYTWSLFKGAIEKDFGWQGNQLNDPYALCCLVFAFAMIAAGRVQDIWGPRITATIGGVLVAAGFLLASSGRDYSLWLLGFGIMAGAGIGFGYSSATPPALKWFPPEKTGLIAGIVVAGFGLAPVYLAPLSDYLLREFGLLHAMRFLGIAFAVMVCGLAAFLRNPPCAAATSGEISPRINSEITPEHGPLAVLRKGDFWKLWVLYFIGSGSGLMVISSIGGMAKKSMGAAAFVAVALMAVGNAGGRIAAGILSDRIGRTRTLRLAFVLQAALMFASIEITASSSGALLLVLAATGIGFFYGSNLSLFPSLTKDLWGLRDFGTNYGLIFTSWGCGGFVLSRLQQMLKTGSGSYSSGFLCAGILLLLGAALTRTLREGSPSVRQ